MTSPTDVRKPLRVVAWSTGTVGRHAIAGIDAHPDLELVGVWVSNPDKAGKDAGQLAELGRDLGVAATTDRDALLALAPDAIVHTAMADDRVFECIEDLFGFVEAGVNVVSSGPVLLQWPEKILPDECSNAWPPAGARTGASLHVNGIDPGFANDVLPLSLTSLSQRIDEVRVKELADYSTYYQPVVMREIFGFGKPMEEGRCSGSRASSPWPGGASSARSPPASTSPRRAATEEVERRPADRDLETGLRDIAEGTMGAVRFQVIGKVDGVPRVVLEHVTRTSPTRHRSGRSRRRVAAATGSSIAGEPMMHLDFTHHGEHGDHNVSRDDRHRPAAGERRPRGRRRRAGLVTALDLPLVTGRGLVST